MVPTNDVSSIPGKLLRVLLLDDDEIMLDLGVAMLRSLGVTEVLTACDGEQGLAVLDVQTVKPNLLICDLRMPGMDGIEFLRHVASRGYQGDVILLSGVAASVLKAAERLAREHGLNLLGVLEKPVEKHALAGVLAGNGRGLGAGGRSGPVDALTPEEVRAGIDSGCVDLYYQPKVSLRERRVLGVECLARWHHPQRGLLSPAAFVPVVEQYGMINDFTLAIFRKAAMQQRAWRDRGRTVKINVNVSMDNLRQIGLPELLEAIAAEAGIEVGDIVLEMTESRLLNDLKVSLDILIRLRLKGFGLSIDDFGTGYSTLETLKQLPFSELKVDRAFVNGAAEDSTARAILDSSVYLARTLGLNVVAEGVEDQQDWDMVAQAGCDEVQGYFVARPMPGQEVIDWMDRWEHPGEEQGMDEKPYIVVVDDDEATRDIFTLAMEEKFRVATVDSGEAALALLGEGLPDAVLLDVEMQPGAIDGYETCRRIKADDALADVPVIFVSARDRIEDRLLGYEAGGEDYLVKPFDRQELEAKLAHLLKVVEERSGLKKFASEAASTAMTAMTSMSEMGALLETMKAFSLCVDYCSLADAVLSGLALYGLRGTVQVRASDEVLTRSDEGEASPLEISVIGHMAGMERITQFKSRMAITYRCVSVLIHNMPLDDPERCGRLRDHLAMLAEGAEARVAAIAANAESQRRGRTMEHAAARITATLADIDRAQRENQVAVRLAMDALTERMQSALVSVAISTNQEDFLIGTLQEGLNRLLNTHTGFAGLQDQLSSIVNELKQMSGKAPSVDNDLSQ